MRYNSFRHALNPRRKKLIFINKSLPYLKKQSLTGLNMDQPDDELISYATNKRNIKKQKLVFVGEQNVGKTSIINRFIKNSFDASHNPTIGIDFVSKNVTLAGKVMRLQLWDTAGQERFRSLIPGYLRDCQVAFIVFDITAEETFNSVPKWIDFVKDNRGQDVILFIVGNKVDLESSRAVDIDACRQKFAQLGAQYVEVSAKTGENIEQVFQKVCAKLLGLPPDSKQALELEEIKQLPQDNEIEKNGVTKREQEGKKSQVKADTKGTKLSSKEIPHRIKQKNCC